MTVLLTTFGVAVTGALLGSAHCVGMCGPFVGIVSAGRREGAAVRQACYQLGRLTSYLGLGALAGALGATVMRLARVVDLQLWLSLAMGAVLVAMGLHHLLGAGRAPSGGGAASRIVGALTRLSREAGPYAGPYLLGMSSTLLPCGFLYAFAVAAAATGTVPGAMVTMLGLWVGSLPALGATAWLAGLLRGRLVPRGRRAVGVALIVLGVLGLGGKLRALPAAPASSEGLADAPSCCEDGAPPIGSGAETR